MTGHPHSPTSPQAEFSAAWRATAAATGKPDIAPDLDVLPGERIGAPPARRRGRLLRRGLFLLLLSAAGALHWTDPALLPWLGARGWDAARPTLEHAWQTVLAQATNAPKSRQPETPGAGAEQTAATDAAARSEILAAGRPPQPAEPSTPPLSSAEAAGTLPPPSPAPAPSAAPDRAAAAAAAPAATAPTATARTEPIAVAPPAPAAAQPVAPAEPPAEPRRGGKPDALQARAETVGLHPDLSRALLARLSEADFRNAALAIRKALAETADGAELVWPRERKGGLAAFRVHFVPGAAPDCRRYVVTVAKDGWLTTALPMERCGTARRTAERQ